MDTNRSGERTRVDERAATWILAAQQLNADEASILIATADRKSAQALVDALDDDGYRIMLAHDRGLALRLSVWELPNIILLDTRLSGGDDGIALCASLKRDARTRAIPIILTADSCNADEHLRCIEAGADDYLCCAAYHLLVARVRALLQVRRWIDNLIPLEQVIQALEQAVDAKDDYTGGHLRRLASYAALIGQQLGFSEQAIDALRAGARLHDIGKIGVADAILRKPAALTADEYHQIMQHPQIGAQVLAPLVLDAEIVSIVTYHHERWDGCGYPAGLIGENIPLGARIVAVADAFDAMTAERPYSRPMTIEAAIERLCGGAGVQWDPAIVAALVECLAEIAPCQERAVGEELAELEAPERCLRAWLQTAAAQFHDARPAYALV
jgi:putative two-component system response regulator